MAIQTHTQMLINGGLWKREKIIGRGGSALVFLAIANPTQAMSGSYLPPLMAVKSTEVDLSSRLIKERKIFSALNSCQYIIKCYGDKLTLENNQKIYNLLLEFASGGSLYDRIKSFGNDGLPENEVKHYTMSIVQGLKHIHGFGYVHRDIKPQNILICDNNVAKIADFGFSKKSKPRKRDKDKCRLKGTLCYLAPESILYNDYETKCDVWALGCVVLEMITGKRAFNRPPDGELNDLLRLITCSSSKLPSIPEEVSKVAKDFIEKCLDRNPKRRWTADALLGHPFLANNNNYEEIEVPTEKDEALIEAAETTTAKEATSSKKSRFDFSCNLIQSDTLYSSIRQLETESIPTVHHQTF